MVRSSIWWSYPHGFSEDSDGGNIARLASSLLWRSWSHFHCSSRPCLASRSLHSHMFLVTTKYSSLASLKRWLLQRDIVSEVLLSSCSLRDLFFLRPPSVRTCIHEQTSIPGYSYLPFTRRFHPLLLTSLSGYLHSAVSDCIHLSFQPYCTFISKHSALRAPVPCPSVEATTSLSAMAIRDRIRKTFGKKESPSPTGSDAQLSTKPSEYHCTSTYSYTGRTDVEYYKPHEVPKSKYRGKVDPEHKDLLEAYSFTIAFSSPQRRASQALSGVMSPGGTKSQSRRTSCVSRDSRSARNSISSAAGPPKSVKVLEKQTAMTGMPPHMGLVRENSDDDTNPLNGEL